STHARSQSQHKKSLIRMPFCSIEKLPRLLRCEHLQLFMLLTRKRNLITNVVPYQPLFHRITQRFMQNNKNSANCSRRKTLFQLFRFKGLEMLRSQALQLHTTNSGSNMQTHTLLIPLIRPGTNNTLHTMLKPRSQVLRYRLLRSEHQHTTLFLPTRSLQLFQYFLLRLRIKVFTLAILPDNIRPPQIIPLTKHTPFTVFTLLTFTHRRTSSPMPGTHNLLILLNPLL